MHYHYTDFGLYTRSWQQATAMYEKIMQEDERINYISVVRDARSHFLSFYYFYVQPEVHVRTPYEKMCGLWHGVAQRKLFSKAVPRSEIFNPRERYSGILTQVFFFVALLCCCVIVCDSGTKRGSGM